MTAPTRVVIGEDDVLMREGIARILGEAGYEIVAQAGDADELLRKALAHHAAIAIVDVKMPPHRSDDGLRAAIELRRQRPGTGVLILSQYCEERYAVDLIGDRAEGVGYLLKERVGDVEAFLDAVGRVASGGSALDPEVVSRMLGRRSQSARRADAAGGRGARGDGGGQVERGHRRRAGRHRGGRGEARDANLPEARPRTDGDRAPASARRPDYVRNAPG